MMLRVIVNACLGARIGAIQYGMSPAELMVADTAAALLKRRDRLRENEGRQLIRNRGHRHRDRALLRCGGLFRRLFVLLIGRGFLRRCCLRAAVLRPLDFSYQEESDHTEQDSASY